MSTDLRGALDKLFALEKGWLDGDAGKPVTEEARERSDKVLSAMNAANNPSDSVFPTEDGGIRFYWSQSEDKMTVDIDPDGSVSLHRVGMTAGFQYLAFVDDSSLRAHLAVPATDSGDKL